MKALILGVLITVPTCGANQTNRVNQHPLDSSDQQSSWEHLHRRAVDRRRRIIFNNDGNEPVYFCKAATAAELLDARTTALEGSHVDSIFYCTWSSGFGLFTHDTKVGQVFNTEEAMFKTNRTQQFLDAGLDPLKVMIAFAHKRGIELFWSMRMNDTHDGARAEYGPVMFRANQLKQERPEWLIGAKDKPPRYGTWSAVDYGVPEIRELAFRYCEEVCQNYDVDGIELDFFRHAFLFRCSGRGEPCGEPELKAMSELMRRIRSMADQIGRKRGRPILVATRVPDSVEYCKIIGIDLEQWLGEKLVDLLVVSGYTQLNPWEYSVALAKKHSVKVYPSLDEPRVRDPTARTLRASSASYRGRAMNVWGAGADGVYLFNLFDPQSSLWRELGEPAQLHKLERTFFASVRGPGSMPVPHQKFIKVPVLNPANPILVAPGKTENVGLLVAENLARPRPKPQVVLALQLKPVTQSLNITLNAKQLSAGKTNASWIKFSVDPDLVRNGINEVKVANSSKTTPVALLDLYLSVTP
jgi:hypothetical protein